MLPADDEEQVARRTIRDGGKRVRISTIENRLSRERGGVWRHEERVPREGNGFVEVCDNYGADNGDEFYRLANG